MGNQSRLDPMGNHNALASPAATASVRFAGSDAFITISAPKRRGLWSAFMLLLHQNGFHVLNATLSTTSANTIFHCIHAQIPVNTNMGRADLQFEFEALILKELGRPSATPDTS